MLLSAKERYGEVNEGWFINNRDHSYICVHLLPSPSPFRDVDFEKRFDALHEEGKAEQELGEQPKRVQLHKK